jgi:hypothetical protein
MASWDTNPKLDTPKYFLGEIPDSWLHEPTKSKLLGSGMAISKNATGVLEVTDFEIIVRPLKLKLKIDTNYTNIYIEL